MSAERDAGLAAMQSGDISTAIHQLETAVQQNPSDYQAAMYLGAAYGQAQRHADAVTILTKAVQIEPANPQARYNLGVAMEQGGWTEQAKQAFEQALTLQPDYAKAQEALARTQAALGTPSVDPMNMPTTMMSPQQTGYAPQTTYTPQTTQQMPSQPPAYTPPTQQMPQPGYGQPPAYGQPSPYGQPPAYGQQYPAPYGQQPPAPQYSTPHYAAPVEIKNYLVPSILVTLFCCQILGIIGIVYAAQVNGKAARGDIAGATEAANRAKTYCWIGFGIGLPLNLIWIIINIMNVAR